jgi:hypothetical protein
MENLDVITIGEAMAMFVATETGDLAEVEHFMKRVAGAELNVATGLARLGLKVGWVSRVGNDSFGRFVLQSLAKEGSIATLSPSTTASLPVSDEIESRKWNRSHCGVFPQRLCRQPSVAGRFSRRLLHQRPPSAPERRGRRAL